MRQPGPAASARTPVLRSLGGSRSPQERCSSVSAAGPPAPKPEFRHSGMATSAV